jgi:hypothetical protein
VNAAFLLVTTAWFAGDTAAATPAPTTSACCGTSRDACDCGGHKLLDKLRGAFKRNDCCDTCAAPKCHAPAPKCHAPAPKCHAPKCAPATCDSCGHGGPKLLDRLKAHFHHDKGCCDGGSSACCGNTATPSSGETIPTPPKKMPNPSKVGIDTEPAGTFQATPAFEAAPNAEQVPPAVVPNVESENLRNPF